MAITMWKKPLLKYVKHSLGHSHFRTPKDCLEDCGAR